MSFLGDRPHTVRRLFQLGLFGIFLVSLFDICIGMGVPVFLLVVLLLAGSLGILRLMVMGSRWVGRLSLVVLVLLVCSVSAEVVFRAAFSHNCLPISEQEFERRITSTWPRPIQVERRPGTLRILGLSDSFGRAGNQDNFHYLLERRLRHEGVKAEVINLSLTGLSPTDEL